MPGRKGDDVLTSDFLPPVVGTDGVGAVLEWRKEMFDVRMTVPIAPLYREEFEHDNCGIGACVNIKGK